MMMGAAQVAPAPLLCQLGDACRSKDATRGKRLKAAALTSWRAGLRQDICAKCPALDEKRRAVAESEQLDLLQRRSAAHESCTKTTSQCLSFVLRGQPDGERLRGHGART